jgi:glycolate oxidase FAD binding subunit
MTADLVRLRELFGAESVGTWEPASPALAGYLPEQTPVVSPGSLEVVQEVLRFAARERLRVLPAGAMEHLHLGAFAAGVDFLLSSRRLDRILEFEPEDLTLVAQAGVTLREIEARAAASGQRLAPDPGPGTAATLGGACAANRSGLRRLRSGTLRDHVLGVRAVHADGEITRTGGKVVKNVTGFDLAKLYVGSHGSLVFLGEIAVRLVPRPATSALVHALLAPDVAQERLLDVHRSWLRPAALVVLRGGRLAASRPELEDSPGRLHVFARFEGRSEVVRAQVEECVRRWGGVEPPAERGEATWEAIRGCKEPEPGHLVLELSTLPVEVVGAVEAASDACGAEVFGVGLFGVGTTWVRVPIGKADRLDALRAHIEAGGGRARVIYAPAAQRAVLAEPEPPAPALQAALKAAYDPAGGLRPAPFAVVGVGSAAGAEGAGRAGHAGRAGRAGTGAEEEP